MNTTKKALAGAVRFGKPCRWDGQDRKPGDVLPWSEWNALSLHRREMLERTHVLYVDLADDDDRGDPRLPRVS